MLHGNKTSVHRKTYNCWDVLVLYIIHTPVRVSEREAYRDRDRETETETETETDRQTDRESFFEKIYINL